MSRYTMGDKCCAIYGSTFEQVRAPYPKLIRVSTLHPLATLCPMAREWLFTYALPTVKQFPYIPYESHVRLHLESVLRTNRLTNMTVELLQQFFNQER